MRIAIITRYRNYPKGDFPGGDETVHHMIEKLFITEGHSVDFIGMDDAKAYYSNNWILNRFGGKFLLIEPVYLGRYFETIKHNYDAVICNGEYGAYIHHPRTIVLYHFSSLGYMENYVLKIISLQDILKLKIFSRLYYFSKRKKLEVKAAQGHTTVAVSEYVGKFLERQGFKPDYIIPNAIDTEFFKPIPGAAKLSDFLFVGRYDHYGKGFDFLEKLASRGLKIDCYTNKDQHKVLFMKGLAKKEDMPGIYNKYKMLVFASRYESCPMVPLEAMSCGLPIVMSNVGIGPELMKVIPEFVVDGWDDSACDEYLKRIQLIQENYLFYSQKARQYVLERHSLEGFKKNWLSLINQGV